jgi:hypothetical protein
MANARTTALVPPHVAKWQFVEEHARGVLDAHAHREVRPPLSRDDGSLAGLAACYAAHAATLGDPVARWYALGPVLAPDGSERRRIAVALFGVAEPSAESELATLAMTLLEQCGLEGRRLVRGRGAAEATFTVHVGGGLLCEGGRADELVGRAGGPPTPAVGFVIDLDALVGALADADEGYQPVINVLVSARDDAATEAALAAAGRLRGSGIRTDFEHRPRSADENLAHAAATGARLLAVVAADGAIELIDVDSGDAESVTADDLDLRVAQLLD